MHKLLQQWRGFSAHERSQYGLEVWGAVTLSTFLVLVAISFAASPNMVIFSRIGGRSTALTLALGALIGALLAPALVPLRLRLSAWLKQRAYAFLAVSPLFYSLAVFLVTRDMGALSAGAIFYVMFYNALAFAGACLYRDS